jgi:uncharacterized membrane protein YhhN
MNALFLEPGAWLTLISTLVLVASDLARKPAGRYLFKPLAALGFLWVAWSLGALDSSYGLWVFVGLVFCAAGDLCLMWRREAVFLAGLVAFLIGHVLYCVAFLQLPANLTGLAFSALPVLVLVVGSLRWLRPHLHGLMRVAVPAYVLVISTMVACASLSWGQASAVLAVAGAWGFAFSDLAVARDRFVNENPLNGLWGTPLYFGSQLLLAASAAASMNG